MASLKVEKLTIELDSKKVAKNVSFSIPSDSVACLIGPSGAGKTSILRAIAGFLRLEQGHIELDGRCVQSNSDYINPEDRSIGFVFQDFALFPHLNVFQNVAFGVREKASTKIVYDMLDLVGLSPFSKKYTYELSGGQKQRVAIARALASQPKLMLFDEPFSQLDPDIREHLADDLKRILSESKISSLIVTHHQEEAFQLADQIGVLNDGHLCQWATAYDLYHKPATRFVADFIGSGSFIEGEVVNDYCVKTSLGLVEAQLPPGLEPGRSLSILVRPDDVVPDEDGIRCEITHRKFRGAYFLYKLQTKEKQSLLSIVPSHLNFPLGEELKVKLSMKHLVCFPSIRDQKRGQDVNLIQ